MLYLQQISEATYLVFVKEFVKHSAGSGFLLDQKKRHQASQGNKIIPRSFSVRVTLTSALTSAHQKKRVECEQTSEEFCFIFQVSLKGQFPK